MQNGDRVQFVSCPELPAAPDSATFYYLQDTDKLYLGSQLIANNVKDVQNSETPGKLRITQFDGSTREIDIPGNAFGIDCYKGKFPLDFTSPGGAIDEWKIHGNSNGPAEVIETQSTLPVSIDTYGGNAVDWEIYGNNNPVVETESNTLPIDISSSGGNAVDYTIYGNDENGTENLFNKDNAGNIAKIFPYQNVISSSANTTSIFVPCEPNTTYTICKQSGERFIAFWTKEYPAASVSYYGEIADNTATSITITTGSDAEYVCAFVHNSQYDTTSLVDMLASIMIVKGSTAPDHYIPYQKGVGEKTKNLIDLVTISGEHNGIEFVTDKSSGTYTLNGTANANYLPWISGNITLKAGISYKLSGCVAGGSASTYIVYTYINNTYYRDVGNGVTIPALNEDTECHISIAVYNGTVFENTVFKPMLREANTSDTFIPYGYQIPLTISQQGQTNKNYDIFIGDAPLTEGETVSKSSTGVDLELFSGDNIIDTSLYNKPNTSITYNSSVLGVGENTEIEGELPIDFRSNGDDLLGYRIYGTAEGAGVQTENLFDISSVVDGYINAYGVLAPGSQLQAEKASDYIEIDSSTAYTISAVGGFPSLTGFQGWRSIAYFDSNKSFLARTASAGTSDLSATSGTTAKYVRISYRSYREANLQIMLTKGSTAPTTYIPYGYKLPLAITSGTESTVTDIYIGGSKLSAEEYVDYQEQKVYKRTENLFNYKTMSDGLQGHYLTASGYEGQSQEWTITDYIPCEGSKFVLSKVGGVNPAICGYNAQKEFVDGQAYNTNGVAYKENVIVTFNANVKFIRFSYYNVPSSPNNDDVTTLMLTEGSTPPKTYIPYLQPTDPPLPFPALDTFKGTNTLDSTVEVGETMITQGYRIPLQIQQGATTKTADFYIGSAPLTEGQSVSKASSGTDIALYQGNNTISTTLGNKPEMRIDYLSTVVGVGERTENLFDFATYKSKLQINPVPAIRGTVSFGDNNVTITASDDDTYTQSYNPINQYVYTVTVEPNTQYTLSWKTDNATKSGKVFIFWYEGESTTYTSGTSIQQGIGSLTITTTSTTNKLSFRFSVQSAGESLTYSDIMLIKGSTAPETYKPYGYQIPIDIKQDDEVVDHKDIYIGTQPLVEGDYINQTGVYRRLQQFVNYIDSEALPEFDFIPITEQLVARNGENTITISLVNNTTIDVELHPTTQASWICGKLEDLQRRIDNVDSTVGAPERRNYLVTWCSEARLTHTGTSDAPLTTAFTNSFESADFASALTISGTSYATGEFIQTIDLLAMVTNYANRFAGSSNYTVARPGDYAVIIYNTVCSEIAANQSISLQIVQNDNAVITQALTDGYVGCVPFKILNLDFSRTVTQVRLIVESADAWTTLNCQVDIAIVNASMVYQDSAAHLDTDPRLSSMSLYDTVISANQQFQVSLNDLTARVEALEQGGGSSYNETQTDTVTDAVEEVTQ